MRALSSIHSVICILLAILLLAAPTKNATAKENTVPKIAAADSKENELLEKAANVAHEAKNSSSARLKAENTISTKNGVPVGIEHEGGDKLGQRLVLRLKERLSMSPLFHLAGPDEKKIIIRIMTKEEFPSRPQAGCLYSVVWIFQESQETLSYFLGQAVGASYQEGLTEDAESIVSQTDKVRVRSSYLFEE